MLPFEASQIQLCARKRDYIILDLRHNEYLTKKRVKYEDWKIAMSYFTAGAFMFSFDLKSGYHHIEISRNTRFTLAFRGQTPFSIKVSHVYDFAFWVVICASRFYQKHLSL